jgi:hypothetical protein
VLDPVPDGLATAGLTPSESGATCDATEGIGDGWGAAADVIEGEDPVVAGEMEELGGGSEHGGEGHGGGVDHGAEDPASEGFAEA